MATVQLLQLKSDFYRYIGEHFTGVTGVVTGGDTHKVTDTNLIGYQSETWPAKFEGNQVRITSGVAVGDLRLITRFDRSEGDLYANRQFSGTLVTGGDTYEVWGSSINGGTPLTNLFNDVLRDLRPVTDTQITEVTNQSQYDITATVRSARGIREVYLRVLDPAGLRPYYKRTLRRGLEWDAYDRGGGGTTSVTLDLFAPRILNASVETLWVRAETGFTAFPGDLQTVDAVYRDWIAWEAVYEFCLRKVSQSASDSSRWNRLLERALEKVVDLRAEWIPREPIQISTFP